MDPTNKGQAFGPWWPRARLAQNKKIHLVCQAFYFFYILKEKDFNIKNQNI
jgi:hypothetical protein